MKKLTFLILCWATLFHITQAQDYKLTFALQGEVTSIDSVVVENATKNKSIKLNGNDTLVLTKMVNANQVSLSNEPFQLKAYPNPSESFITVQFKTNQPEPVIITVFDLRGSALASQKWNPTQGNHSFQIKNLSAGMYLVQVSSENYSERIKIISLQNNAGTPEIGAIRSEEPTGINLLTKSATSAQLLGYEEYDNIVVRVWPTLAPWELTRGFVMDAEEPPIEETSEFVITYQKCEDSCGNVYNTVELGDQIWMAENFRCATENSWAYNDDENNTETYGRLYTWEDALNNAPEGWHLPSNEEWNKMQEYVQNTYEDNLPVALKSKTGWFPDEIQNSTNGTDASGFNMMPAGARWFLNGTFYAAGESAYFWTSTEIDSIRARMRKFTSSDTEIGEGASNVGYGFSVRYVKDKPIEEGEVLVSGSLDESLLDIIDFGELTINSVNDSNFFQADGSFSINSYLFDNGEQPPILFSKDGEAVFGFYPELVSGNKITVDDMMYFYFDLSSDIRSLELTKQELIGKAINSQKYNSTVEALITSLQNNILPADNPEFITAFKNLISDIIQIQQTKSIQAGTYEFEFDRKGNINWEGKLPVFAAMELEIKKVDGNLTVFGPENMEGDSYMFSPTSWLAYGFNYFFNKESLGYSGSFKLPSEGEYIISLCNNSENIYNHNRYVFMCELIQLFFPTNYFKYFNSDCVNSITSTLLPLMVNIKESFENDESFSSVDLANMIKDLPLSILGIVNDCSNFTFSSFIESTLDLTKKLDVINYGESSLNLSLLIRDGYLSEMSESYPRYFYDNLSFSDLIFYDFPIDTLKGESQETFTYISKIDEKVYSFDFQRGNTETILKLNTVDEFASGLPFQFTRQFGNADYGNEIIYSENGDINTILKMGTENSQIIIKPAFKNSGLIPDTVILAPNLVTPKFEVVGAYCQGDDIPPLPTTSINEITGTWSPEINNTETTTYTFMPDEGQNADTVTMEIVVTPKVDPTFEIQTSYSKSDSIPALPTQSTNNILGTWQPEINNQTTTTYTFTPNSGQCANQTTITITIEENDEGTFTDSRDGRVYKTVTIGNQVWMAENLAYLPAVNLTEEVSYDEPRYYVYNYNGTDVTAAKALPNYSKLGVLYNWAAANISCPPGWHLPTDDEWEQLADHVNSIYGPYSKYEKNWNGIGKHLKADNTWNTFIGNLNVGTDDLGFSALPGGIKLTSSSISSFREIYRSGYWWSATEESEYSSWRRELESSSLDFLNYDYNKNGGFSVRCIKD